MYSQASIPSQPKTKIVWNSVRQEKWHMPILCETRLLQDCLRAFSECAQSQQGAREEFVCSQKYLAKRYLCGLKHTTYLFKKCLEAGMLEITKDEKYNGGTDRRFKFTEKYMAEIELYLANFTPPPIAAAQCTNDEITDISPTIPGPFSLPSDLEKSNEPSNDKCMYLQGAPKMPVASKYLCSGNSFELGKIYAEEYLGYFKDFNEKKRVVKLIGEAVDKKGLQFIEDVFLELSQNIGDYQKRRIKLTDYLARIKNE